MSDWAGSRMKNTMGIVIYRNPGAVFEYLTEPEKMQAWIDDLIVATPAAELALDAPYLQVVQVGWSQERLTGRVRELVRNEKFSFSLATAASRINVSFQLSPEEGGASTRLLMTEEMFPEGLWAKLLMPILTQMARKKQAAELKSLKKILDRGEDKS